MKSWNISGFSFYFQPIMASILLVEDDLTFSRILEGFLKKHGHQVAICNKGKDGMKSFHDKSFDVVLLDYRLPDANGMDLLTEMKGHKPDVPVIIMTSFNDLRTAVKAIKSGAMEYITKPVNPEELLMLLKQAIQKDQIADKKHAMYLTRSIADQKKDRHQLPSQSLPSVPYSDNVLNK